VNGQNGYALLTTWLSRGDYTLKLISDNGADVRYTLAYTSRDDYSVAPHGIYKAKVVCIASCGLDGDTIKVNVLGKEAKVRVIGVNTPEISHNGNPAQCYGNEARDFTDKHLNGRWIYLQFDNEIYDKYQRYLAYVWLTYPELHAPDSGYMWNAVLAEEGYAKILSLMPNVQYAWLFSRLQYEAMKAHRGLWGACESH
jgi:micrococcal nuclease